jgi:hypothetical protein
MTCETALFGLLNVLQSGLETVVVAVAAVVGVVVVSFVAAVAAHKFFQCNVA